MKEIVTRSYQCEICQTIYKTEELARECEAHPVEAPIFKVGDFVGCQVHGWWNSDTSWALSQPCNLDNLYSTPSDKWERSPPGPFPPGKMAFLPIFRVVAFRREQRQHRLTYLLWSPRHANRRSNPGADYGEALNWTPMEGHIPPIPIPEALWPTLITRTEDARFRMFVERPPWRESFLL